MAHLTANRCHHGPQAYRGPPLTGRDGLSLLPWSWPGSSSSYSAGNQFAKTNSITTP